MFIPQFRIPLQCLMLAEDVVPMARGHGTRETQSQRSPFPRLDNHSTMVFCNLLHINFIRCHWISLDFIDFIRFQYSRCSISLDFCIFNLWALNLNLFLTNNWTASGVHRGLVLFVGESSCPMAPEMTLVKTLVKLLTYRGVFPFFFGGKGEEKNVGKNYEWIWLLDIHIYVYIQINMAHMFLLHICIVLWQLEV